MGILFRVLHPFWFKGGGGGGLMPPLAFPRGGILNSRRGIPIFTNNMIFLECGVIAVFEAFYICLEIITMLK